MAPAGLLPGAARAAGCRPRQPVAEVVGVGRAAAPGEPRLLLPGQQGCQGVGLGGLGLTGHPQPGLVGGAGAGGRAGGGPPKWSWRLLHGRVGAPGLLLPGRAQAVGLGHLGRRVPAAAGAVGWGGAALGDAALLGRVCAAARSVVLLGRAGAPLVLGLVPVGLAIMLLSCLGGREGGEVVQGRAQVQQGPAGPAGAGHGAQQGSQPLESGQVQLSLLVLQHPLQAEAVGCQVAARRCSCMPVCRCVSVCCCMPLGWPCSRL